MKPKPFSVHFWQAVSFIYSVLGDGVVWPKALCRFHHQLNGLSEDSLSRAHFPLGSP